LGEKPSALGEDFSLISYAGIEAQSHKGTQAQRAQAKDLFFSLPFASLSLCPFVPQAGGFSRQRLTSKSSTVTPEGGQKFLDSMGRHDYDSSIKELNEEAGPWPGKGQRQPSKRRKEEWQ
jgi:hypothetical protein